MNTYSQYENQSVFSNPVTDYDLILTIDLGISELVECSSDSTKHEIGAKEIFRKYFKDAVPEMFKNDKRFYVDYVHDSTKMSDSTRITKSGHTASESRYMVLYAKNSYGFVINSWIVQLRLGEHPSVKDTSGGEDVRAISRENYLNDFDRFGSNLEIDKDTFNKMEKKSIDIVVRCGTRLQSNTTVHVTDEPSKRFQNVDKALSYINLYKNTLYNKVSDNITTFFYKGYKISGDENMCDVFDQYDEIVESDTTMSEARTLIDILTTGLTFGKVYGSINKTINFSKSDLLKFADRVIEYVSEHILDESYWIEWRDIHFEDDFEFIVIDTVDSDYRSYLGDLCIDFDKFVQDIDYNDLCAHELANQIADAYCEADSDYI